MGFEPYGLLILGHVLFASLWFGAGVYQVLVIGRGLMAAGPAAGGFVVALMQKGGIGRFFAISGILTILFGGALYGQLMADDSIETFSGRGLWLTLGSIMAVLAFLHGLTVNMPTERKLIALCKSLKGHPTKEQSAQIGAMGQKLGKAGLHGVTMVATAMLLMLLSRVFP
ncbi:MAG: hypothetical protein WC876_00145 [Candidatus Thermoplasmatota archaeon]|jgi:hypothetical protein